MNKRIVNWFKNISITKKLYFVVSIMAILIAVELATLLFAVNSLSAVRAYVGGEGLWSKAQKDAVYYLQKYGNTLHEADYIRAIEFMKIPLGDRKSRTELAKKDPDFKVAYNGFLEGDNHPDDIKGMIQLFRRFHSIYYIEKSIIVWGQADSVFSQIMPIAERLHEEIRSPEVTRARINLILKEIDPINDQLTILENKFSSTLGEGSRWLENLILKILFFIAITVEFTGLFLTISVSISISKGISEVVRVADKVSTGDLNEKAKVFSNDEIGQLAESFNKMVGDLNEKIIEKNEAEIKLKKQKDLLEISNKDLEQFAFVVSHDLREPLRTVNSYVQLLQQRYGGQLDADGNEFIDFAVDGVSRMNALISDILSYSQIGTQNKEKKWVNGKIIIEKVIAAMEENILMNEVKITYDEIPFINVNEFQIFQLFQNLISNAIKFRGKEHAVIHISVKEEKKDWLFSVRDNGIGIDKKYLEKIFVIFQRLHSRIEYEGTGIGLAICKKIVEQHEGKIWVESEPGVGSCFYFTLKK